MNHGVFEEFRTNLAENDEERARYSHSSRITIQSIRVPSTKNRRIPLDSETSALTDSNIWKFPLIAKHTCLGNIIRTRTSISLHTRACKYRFLTSIYANLYLNINVSKYIYLDIHKLFRKRTIIEIS